MSNPSLSAWQQWREQHLTRRAFRWLKTRLPKLSVTEQVALAAGDVWWEAELFNGKPAWHQLHSLPAPQLSAEEQAFIDQPLNQLCGMIDDWQFVQQKELSPEVWNYLRQGGFWALQIPKAYGGLGFSAQAHSIIISKIASRSLSVAVAAMVPNSLGPAELLLHYGTEAQKQHYLPRLAKGEEVPCFALTGLEVGSDAGGMPDKGTVCYGDYQGERVLGIRLSWEKRYITLAPIATLLGVAFKLFDPEHLLGDKTDIGITLALVPVPYPGVETGKRHRPLGLAFPNGPTRGKDVFIPLDWIIGGAAMAGQGWRMLMECLSIGRGISLPALSAGVSQLCYRASGAYAAVRKQFKQPIGQFEGVMQALARIGGLTFIIEATRAMTAQAVDQQVKPTIASAIAKYHLTEMARQVVNDAMDVHAGRAIQTGPANYLTMPYMGAPMSITVEGANILTRNLIIFGQGAIRCHRFLKQEIALLAQPENDTVLHDFAAVFYRHLAAGGANFLRTLLAGITVGYSVPRMGAADYLQPYYRQVNRMSSALAFVSDVTLLVCGGDLKRREFLSARLGDVFSYLYLASAVLKYMHDQHHAQELRPYAHWALQYCLAQLQQAFVAFFDNFPRRWLGKLLYRVVFPWGDHYSMPADRLTREVATSMLHPSPLRERLSQQCYVSNDTQDALGKVEYAFALQQQAAPVQQKLQLAQQTGKIDRHADLAMQLPLALTLGLLSADEVALLQRCEAARLAAIGVDEF